MTKHKKFLKTEKQKTKFKAAKLPKGLNVTKTEFKVRKIVIRDQIKESTIVDGTILRSNIKVKTELSRLHFIHQCAKIPNFILTGFL